jgi:Transcriptional regulators, similar to M. xanthus CarD
MKFEVGETVVYPHHGAAKIVEVKIATCEARPRNTYN